MARSAGRRHRGRELALRVLFETEETTKDVTEALQYQAEELGATGDVYEFAEELVRGCIDHRDAVDSAIAAASDNWAVGDLGKVERTVLRIGTFEVLIGDQTPVAVAINEAVELAKAYAGEEAGSFVNGVLGEVERRRVQS